MITVFFFLALAAAIGAIASAYTNGRVPLWISVLLLCLIELLRILPLGK